MKPAVCPLAALILLVPAWNARAQSSSSATYDFDVRDAYGNPLRAPDTDVAETANGSRSYQRARSLNGNMVPLDAVTEKVTKKDAHTMVIEREVQLYDPNGNPTRKERQIITETKSDDGTVNSTSETWRSDVNGQMALAEKKDTTERKTGPGTTESQTTVSEPTINGAMNVVQRDETVREATGQGRWTDTKTIERNGQNGFYEANKIVTDHSETGNHTTENTAEYEIGSNGTLELHQQMAKSTVKSPNGSSVTETDYYNRHAPGYAYDASDKSLALRAREVTEHRVESHGAVDTVSAQETSISDPKQLGASKVVSETVCTGSCK